MLNQLLIIEALFDLPALVYVKLFLAAISVILFCRWLSKKLVKAGRQKVYITNINRLIYAGFLYVAFVWLVFNVIRYEKQVKFDTEKWMAEKSRRHQMAADLIHSGKLSGKDSNLVKHMLGEPSTRIDSVQTWNYYLGNGGGGFGFTIHSLVIEFEGNTVRNVFYHRFTD